MWKQTTPTTMQEFGDYCKNMVQDNGSNGNSIYITLTDIRDNNKYKVARLKDGKCWMVENLRLGGTTQTNRTITPANSDISANYILPQSSTNGFSTLNTANLYIDPTYGGYYNYYAVTAGTGTSSFTSGSAFSSICPKGWRLPTGGSNSEFTRLTDLYGGTGSDGSIALQNMPVPNFTFDGNYYNSHPDSQGEDGAWWSSTANGESQAWFLFVYGSGVNPLYSNPKYRGFTIRCLAY